MTELHEMPIKEEETPICWEVFDFAISQLNLEFNKSRETPKKIDDKVMVPASAVAGGAVSLAGTAIPVVEQRNRSDADQFFTINSGVNHLNLIQIKGKVAHAFQPRLVQEGRSGRAVVFSPLQEDPIAGLELNRILLMAAKKI